MGVEIVSLVICSECIGKLIHQNGRVDCSVDEVHTFHTRYKLDSHNIPLIKHSSYTFPWHAVQLNGVCVCVCEYNEIKRRQFLNNEIDSLKLILDNFIHALNRVE